MKKIIEYSIALSMVMIGLLGGMSTSLIVSQPVHAAGDSCNGGFLGFKAWYDGLVDGDCNIKSPSDVGLSTFIWTIALNIIEIGLMFVAYASIFFILYGGFLFIISLGKPEDAVKARKTILNAVIGLIISIASVAIVNFIASSIN